MEQLQKSSAQAQVFYNNSEYALAAQTLQNVISDANISHLPISGNALYSLARYESRAGDHSRAIVHLRQAVDSAVMPITARKILNETDFTPLHENAGFRKLISELKNREAIWSDSPAIATPYKPVLTENEKIAGLSKFWSEARFNFSHFDRLKDFDWDRSYMEYMPQAQAAKNTADYYRVLMHFAAQLNDSHTQVFPPRELSTEFCARPPLETELVQNTVLITSVNNEALRKQGIHKGMEIVDVDSLPVRSYAEKYIAPYVSSSTPQDRAVRVYDYQLLSGAIEKPVTLTLREVDGREITKTIARTGNSGRKRNIAELKFLPGDIAYLQINSFENNQSAKIMLANFNAISSATSLIIDVRENGGGDSENADAILKMLTPKRTIPPLGYRSIIGLLIVLGLVFQAFILSRPN